MTRSATALAVIFLTLVPSAASAIEATSSEVTRLAEDAAFDDDALSRLKQIDAIDGRAVDLDRLLEGAEGDEIEQRIDTLLTRPDAAPAPRAPAAERAEAERILEQDRYRSEEIPRPFRRQLEWIADRLEPVGNAVDSIFGWVDDVFRGLARGTPGGAATLWFIIGGVIVAMVALQTKRIVERRGRTRIEDVIATHGGRGDDARDLERKAAAARARGDHELAVRLLFRAGLLRLARARAIPARRSLTTGEIRRLLGYPEFDRIGRSFDEIAYGRRPATSSDTDEARVAWSEILQKAAR